MRKIEHLDYSAMEFDELWLLHEDLTKILSEKISAEKRKLEERLTRLTMPRKVSGLSRPRTYPKVLPKYQNPSVPTETWSGRGKHPRWLVAALQSGRTLDDFRISDAGANGKNLDKG